MVNGLAELLKSQTAALELLRQGLCWVYTKYLPEAPKDIQVNYRQAESEARTQRRGLWSDPSPVEPWLYRRQARTNPPEPVLSQ
jgi:endonuclease YncB( thermonuclease family)